MIKYSVDMWKAFAPLGSCIDPPIVIDISWELARPLFDPHTHPQAEAMGPT
jgi:hypothetical protein